MAVGAWDWTVGVGMWGWGAEGAQDRSWHQKGDLCGLAWPLTLLQLHRE